MKDSLKLAIILVTSGIIAIHVGIVIRHYYDTNHSTLSISLPEEIAMAKAGDVLEVYTVSDSIYVRFKHKENSDSPVIIWNDDPESIPMDGELVKLEFTENDTLYISNP
jgi:hypothetical protein